jgi:hypothetical protein
VEIRSQSSIEPLESRIAPAAATLSLADLNGANGFKLNGVSANDFAGYSVSAAGDINGDGFDDVLVGAYLANPNGTTSGASYVVFGKRDGFPASLELSTLDGSDGFELIGGGPVEFFGRSVSAAGDVNGDGVDDVIIGAFGANPTGAGGGASYVVFGRTTPFPAAFDMSTLDGTNGFRLIGAAGDLSGVSVSSAGDMNGDGLSDVIIGAYRNDSAGVNDTGAAYVVFGRITTFPANIDLARLSGNDGFKISGGMADDRAGSAVSDAGDINGDGLDDVLIGAPSADANGLSSGAAYVVFGNLGGFPINLDLATLDGTNGFQLSGAAANDLAGQSVSSAGDFNGDGLDDLMVTSLGAGPNGNYSGTTYLVFGKRSAFPANLQLSTLDGLTGFKIHGDNSVLSGASSSAAGDVNGDGFGDILIGAFQGPPDSTVVGAAYVLFGHSKGFAADFELASVDGTNGFKVLAATGHDGAGTVVSNAGDINNDGFDDLIIGTPDPASGNGPGAAYIVFGFYSRLDVLRKDVIAFEDVDGDLVTIKVAKGQIQPDDLVFAPDGQLQLLKLTDPARFDGANLSITAEQVGAGDGLVNVGAVNAEGVTLGKVKIDGDLGQIDVGNDSSRAIGSLKVGSLGAMGATTQMAGTLNPLFSDVRGSIGKLAVQDDVMNAIVSVVGNAKKVFIGGDLAETVPVMTVGASPSIAAFSGRSVIVPHVSGGVISPGSVLADDIGSFTVMGDVHGGEVVAEGNIKNVKVVGRLVGDDPSNPAVIAAKGGENPGTVFDKIIVQGDVTNAQILAGYNKLGVPQNANASIGAVVVKGNWTASSLVAGVQDTPLDGSAETMCR